MDLSGNADDESIRSCCLSEKQLYERFEKLPAEQRKAISDWASQCDQDADAILIVPKTAVGRPEQWRVRTVDKQRYNAFRWKPIVWIAVNSRYETPKALIVSAMSVLDSLAVPLNMLSNRYEYAKQTVCIEVPVRFGLAMAFIRAQSKATAAQVAGQEHSDAEEKQVRDSWLAEGLSADDYRGFALQLFQVRKERDPAFVLMVFRGAPEKVAVVWFRDVHLVTGTFYKGLFPSALEHLFWPNFDHHPTLDPPLELCERHDCSNCGGVVSDEMLRVTFIKHEGPWKKTGDRLFKERQRSVWEAEYAPQVAAARTELGNSGEMEEAEISSKIAAMEGQLHEQFEKEQSATLIKAIDDERCMRPFKKCTRCKLVRYCSSTCQKDDWTTHSRYCRERGGKK